MGWIKKIFSWLFDVSSSPDGEQTAPNNNIHPTPIKPIEINEVVMPQKNLGEEIIEMGNGEKFLKDLKSIDPMTTRNLTGGEDILSELKKIASQYKYK